MRFKNLILLGLLAALWGPSFLFIKIGVEEIPPLTFVVGRVGLAAFMLLIVLYLRGGHLPAPSPIWRHVTFVSLVHTTLPFVLFSWGEQYIDSALASILNGTTPIFTILLAHFFTNDDRLTPMKGFGALLGLAGLVVLIAPSFVDGIQATTLGLLAVTAAAICYGIAIVYSRNHLRGMPFLVVPTMQMTISTILLIPFSLFIERPYLLPLPSLRALSALLALAIFGTALAFIVYYILVDRADASYVSMVTYLIPIVGIILGVVVLKEQLTWHAYAGCTLILLGVMTVNGVFQFKRRHTSHLRFEAGD